MEVFHLIFACLITYANAQERPDCAAVQCLAPQCTKCEIPVLYRGACCPVCREVPGTNASYLAPPSANCPRTSCPISQCTPDEQALAEPNKCCPTVCVPTKELDCRLVDCRRTVCTKGTIPVRFRNWCCPTCLKVPNTDARSLSPPVHCPALQCKRWEEALVETDGQCCPSICVKKPHRPINYQKPNCSLVLCAFPKCPAGEIPVRFHDQCCHQCVKVQGTNATSLNPPPDCLLLNCISGSESLAASGSCCASVCVPRPCKYRN